MKIGRFSLTDFWKVEKPAAADPLEGLLEPLELGPAPDLTALLEHQGRPSKWEVQEEHFSAENIHKRAKEHLQQSSRLLSAYSRPFGS